jgi:hypothetical protein
VLTLAEPLSRYGEISITTPMAVAMNPFSFRLEGGLRLSCSCPGCVLKLVLPRGVLKLAGYFNEERALFRGLQDSVRVKATARGAPRPDAQD